MIINHAQKIVNLFLPKRCPICLQNSVLANNLCSFCDSKCHICHNPQFTSENFYMGALFYYEFSIKDLIIKAKFNREEYSAHVLIGLIRSNINKNNLNKFKANAIAYIPTHWQSRLFRGFDLPELFARELAHYLKVPVIQVLKLNKNKNRQSSIKRRKERLEAIKGAFSLSTKFFVYERIILVDDILTTGATFREAIRVLRPKFKEIRALAIAKTP